VLSTNVLLKARAEKCHIKQLLRTHNEYTLISTTYRDARAECIARLAHPSLGRPGMQYAYVSLRNFLNPDEQCAGVASKLLKMRIQPRSVDTSKCRPWNREHTTEAEFERLETGSGRSFANRHLRYDQRRVAKLDS